LLISDTLINVSNKNADLTLFVTYTTVLNNGLRKLITSTTWRTT